MMYHIVPGIGSSNYIVVHWDCHGVVRLVLSNGLSHPNSRSDPIGKSEPVSGCETLYWDSLLFFFFFL